MSLTPHISFLLGIIHHEITMCFQNPRFILQISVILLRHVLPKHLLRLLSPLSKLLFRVYI